jgi:hypothetical protein
MHHSTDAYETGPPSNSSMEARMSTSFIGCPSAKARAAARLTTPFPNRRGCNVRVVEETPLRGGRMPRIAIVDTFGGFESCPTKCISQVTEVPYSKLGPYLCLRCCREPSVERSNV